MKPKISGDLLVGRIGLGVTRARSVEVRKENVKKLLGIVCQPHVMVTRFLLVCVERSALLR